jgi:hypothetical protein
MGLLEYQAMPSLCDLTHVMADAAGYCISSQLGRSGKGNRYGKEKTGGTARPPRTNSHLPGQSPLASQAGRRVGPAL